MAPRFDADRIALVDRQRVGLQDAVDRGRALVAERAESGAGLIREAEVVRVDEWVKQACAAGAQLSSRTLGVTARSSGYDPANHTAWQ